LEPDKNVKRPQVLPCLRLASAAVLALSMLNMSTEMTKQVSFGTNVPMRDELRPISQSLACPNGQG
jgi:hypothetical protein